MRMRWRLTSGGDGGGGCTIQEKSNRQKALAG